MTDTIIIGAGPAGLTAAHELQRLGFDARVLEKDPVVGGISRTVEYNGYRFDIGGHRFFTKVGLIRQFWQSLLGDDFLERPRLSRIYYNDKFFDYPLKPMNALRGLGPLEAVRVGLSYLSNQITPHPEERNFEEWVSNRFGTRLYQIFFKTYTEKVWGMPCNEISADWAAQRIKNLDLAKAVKNAILGSSAEKGTITTLIDRFHYPRFGPGMMWQRCREQLESNGVSVDLGVEVEKIHIAGERVEAITANDADGRRTRMDADHVISSMALRDLLLSFDPAPPAEILEAAGKLRYRDFLTVVLIVDREEVFPDNWIYIHSPEVRVGRVQNFKNWSPEMVPDVTKTSLGLEYFVDIGDDLWASDDTDLVQLATREMSTLGLVSSEEVIDGTVVRMAKAYPVYDGEYRETLDLLQQYLSRIENLQVIGRNGQHRYNNQDHSMLAGIWAARNVAGADLDVWSINVEQEYHEESEGHEGAVVDRLVPEPLTHLALEDLLREAFARYDPVALGVATGIAAAIGLFVATGLLILQGGDPLGPTLSLLGHYFLGYQVSWSGAFLGASEAGFCGFLIGFLIAKMINVLVGTYEVSIRRRLELTSTLDPLGRSDT